MKKQTAVEWLQVQLNENGKLSAVDFYQAKEMEKEQIIDAYAQGFIESESMDKGAEQYYNETYKQQTP
jgi:hypothetical protein